MTEYLIPIHPLCKQSRPSQGQTQVASCWELKFSSMTRKNKNLTQNGEVITANQEKLQNILRAFKNFKTFW